MKMRCLIVDDEPIARQIVEKYCSYLSEIELVASCGNALEAKQVLWDFRVDMIFLDINMPLLDGMAFLKTLKNPPLVVFTTAYKEYALDAFEINAVDYLLKPFSLERFIVAVDKVREKLGTGLVPMKSKDETFTFIKTDRKIFKVEFGQVLYAEAKGNQVKIVMQHETIEPTMTLGNLEELLPKETFLRIHRSFIINKLKITSIQGNQVYLNAVPIPLGATYREFFHKEISG